MEKWRHNGGAEEGRLEWSREELAWYMEETPMVEDEQAAMEGWGDREKRREDRG